LLFFLYNRRKNPRATRLDVTLESLTEGGMVISFLNTNY